VASPAVPTPNPGIDGLPGLFHQVGGLVGVKLATYLSGADSVEKIVSSLAKTDGVSRATTTRRLKLVLDLADLFRPRNAITLLRGWLREVDPALGRRSPAQVIRAWRGESAAPLADSAERFLDDRAPRPQSVAVAVRVPVVRRTMGRAGH
jgi:hypothetical protein